MRIALFAKGERGYSCLAALVENNLVPVLLVVERRVDEKALIKLAKDNRIPSLPSQNISAAHERQIVKQHRPDLVVMAGFTQIVKKPLLNIPKYGVLNLHGGKLPGYRGASVINWQIINGEPVVGISIIFADETIDTGDIVAEAEIPLGINDTFTQVNRKVNALFPRMLLKVIKDLDKGTVKKKPQNKADGRYWHKRMPEDGRVHWDKMTAWQVHNLVRALTPPCPGAFTFLDTKKIIIWETRMIDKIYKGVPGRVVTKNDGGYIVIAKDCGLLIRSLETDGGLAKVSLVGKTFCL